MSLARALLEVNGQQNQPLALSRAHHAVSFCPTASWGAPNPWRGHQRPNSHVALETGKENVGTEI